jgi:hypothetical protein
LAFEAKVLELRLGSLGRRDCNLRRHPSDWRFSKYGALTFLFDGGGDHSGKGYSGLQDRKPLVIVRIRAVHHSWSVLAYNCNDFVADVARGMGMQTPVTLSPPYDFIPKPQAINQHALRPTASLASAPVTESRIRV